MIFLSILSILIGSLLSSGTAPTEEELIGEWKYSDSIFVFTEKNGQEPSLAEVESHMNAMGARTDNCSITFRKGHEGTLKLGTNSIDINWELDNQTKVFKASVGMFSIKGYLVRVQDNLILTYTRPNLFLIMRYLCSGEGRKHINPLGKELDCCKGLTLGLEFAK